MDEANRILIDFLPRYSERFAVPPAEIISAYRPIDPALDLASVLCFKYSRRVARDNTVKYDCHTLQLLPGTEHPSYAGNRIEIQKRLDGTLLVCYQGQVISTREAPPRPGLLRSGDRIPGHEPAPIPQWLDSILRQDESWGKQRSKQHSPTQPLHGNRRHDSKPGGIPFRWQKAVASPYGQ